MSVISGTGAVFSIGTTAAATNQAQFDSDTYTAVGEIEGWGPFGDTRAEVRFISLGDGRVKKSRGSADAGNLVLRVGFDPGDAGQVALKNAYEVSSQAADEFNFRIEYNNSLGVNGTTFYFRGRVMSIPMQGAGNDETVMREITIGINSPIIQKAAA